MTTILAISDTHVCHASPRWTECERILTWFAEEACVDADLVIHCGDLYDRTASTKDREFVHWWVHRVTSHCPLIIIRGNHDPIGEIDMLAAHASNHTCYTAETPQVIVEAGVVVQALPWPRVAELAARTGESGQALDEVAREALRDVLRGLGAEARKAAALYGEPGDPCATVLATHALITGAVTSHGQPLVGGELSLGLADLALSGADITIAGHIHAPQGWEFGGRDVAYCGSPFATTFGEHERKSVVRLTLGDDCDFAFERVPTPAQRMIDVGTAWTAGGWRVDAYLATARLLGGDDAVREVDVRGHQVRLRYTVAAEHREAARAEAAKLRDAWLEQGAERVVVEAEIVATSTARAPEIATRTSLAEMLNDLWRVRDDAPADRNGVLGALAELEGSE